MNDWRAVAESAAREAFGPDIECYETQRTNGGYITWTENGFGIALAIGGGQMLAAAWRMLLNQIANYRGSYLTTGEVARIAGVSRQRVHQWLKAGQIIAFTRGHRGRGDSSRFAPEEIARWVLRPQRTMIRQDAPEAVVGLPTGIP